MHCVLTSMEPCVRYPFTHIFVPLQSSKYLDKTRAASWSGMGAKNIFCEAHTSSAVFQNESSWTMK